MCGCISLHHQSPLYFFVRCVNIKPSSLFEEFITEKFTRDNPVEFLPGEIRSSFTAFLHLVLKHQAKNYIRPFVEVAVRLELQSHMCVFLRPCILRCGTTRNIYQLLRGEIEVLSRSYFHNIMRVQHYASFLILIRAVIQFLIVVVFRVCKLVL